MAYLIPLPGATSAHSWKAVHLLNLYRLTLAGLFVVLVLSGKDLRFLGSHDARLYLLVSLAYLSFSVASSFTIRQRWPAFLPQVYLQVSVDILALVSLMHATGGVSSGLGFLLLVSVAGNSLLLDGRASLLFAAVATLAVLGQQLYSNWEGGSASTYLTQAGMLGAALFATALVADLLAQRARRSEALAAQRGVDLANMAQLADYVIDRMQTGALVMDSRQRVWLMNAAARRLLEIPEPVAHRDLEELCPELARRRQRWLGDPGCEAEAFQAVPGGARILPRFARLSEGISGGTLIFLEDLSALAQQAQQLKLAALGRLTASIAHEVRNPLGAISHAAQLLGESTALDGRDARLSQIIHGQCQRVNEIIEDVLQLSRRESSHIQEFALQPWLREFVQELAHGYPDAELKLDVLPTDMQVRMDPLHLRQILYNLCQNGLRYSKAHSGQAVVNLKGRMIETMPVLDVMDRGPGIAPELVEQIFEPFFTTEARGTGLGLYIARELCECNQARLSYRVLRTGGSCFRIGFADVRRRFA
jgi:two-component system, NtrC family, sensor histidine kinase PilS